MLEEKTYSKTIIIAILIVFLLVLPVEARDKFIFGVPDNDTEWFYDGPNIIAVRHSREKFYGILLGPEWATFEIYHNAEIEANSSIYVIEMNLYNFSLSFDDLRFASNHTIANETMLPVDFYNITGKYDTHKETILIQDMGIGNRTTINSPNTWTYDQQIIQNDLISGGWSYRFNITTFGLNYTLDFTLSYVYDIHFENRYEPVIIFEIGFIIVETVFLSSTTVFLLLLWVLWRRRKQRDD